MSDNKWSMQDELQRFLFSTLQNPPRSLNELFDSVDKAIRPQTPTKKSGFDDFVDNPTASTQPPQKEASKSSIDMPIELFRCPSCKSAVFGVAEYEVKDASPTNDGCFTADMQMIGVRVEKHDCTPKVKR